MSFTSYAANFEDVMLWRALQGVAGGCYIDVGAGDPQQGSATAAFYARGWRGINLEPAPGLLRRLRIARPADTCLGLGIGAAGASLPFYEVPDSPLSTFDEAQAQALAASGHTVLLRQAATDTLDAVCAAHLHGALHFLRVGAAADAVFAAFDLARWQPWIVLAPADAGRAALQAAGYSEAYYDGQSRYYVAPGHAALKAALALPPHAADGFVLSEGHAYSHPLAAWQERAAAAEAAAEEARTWAKAHVREWQEKHGRLTEQETIARRAQSELAIMAQRAAAAEGQIAPLTARAVRAGEVEQELAGVYASLSWRVTRPLRDGKLQARRAVRLARRIARKALQLSVRIAKGLLRRAVHFVLQRPRLAFIVRRVAARFPALKRQARSVVVHQAVPPMPDILSGSETELLPEAAQQVLRDLRRTRR